MIKNMLAIFFMLIAVIGLSQCSVGQTPKATESTKADLVKKLIELTLSSHPSTISAEDAKTLLPKDKESEEMEAMGKKDKIELIETVLKENKELTKEQKTFIRANYDQLLKILDKQIVDGIKADFPIGEWIKESLEQGYKSKLTDAELTELITFFQNPAGQKVLKSYKYAMVSETVVQKGGAPLYTKEDKAEADKFAATAVGKNFIEVFFTEANKYSTAKMEAAYKTGGKPENSTFTITDSPNINKIINQFVKDNYKK